ncbi:MAG TPA: hypothetical protein VKU38_23550 [Ktedonobacteraceae bacterium]|nr:hypothetical protein [Ktedonobacteraceae bacterium]
MMISMRSRKNMQHNQIIPQDTSAWVREALEPEQLSTAKKAQRVGKRHLSPATVIILWALRLYVVLMMFIIAYQIWTVIQS